MNLIELFKKSPAIINNNDELVLLLKDIIIELKQTNDSLNRIKKQMGI
jgi:hypothetical protein